MGYRKACVRLLAVLMTVASVLSACGSGGTQKGIYLQTEHTAKDKNGEGYVYKWAYNQDGTLQSYIAQSIEDGQSAGLEIVYQWENGQVTGATMKLPSGDIPVKYDYSGEDPAVLKSITISDEGSPCWLAASCDAQGRVITLEVGDYDQKEPFWNDTYTYREDGMLVESYCYDELQNVQLYDYSGNLLVDTTYMDGEQYTRSVYAYDGNGYRASMERYNAEDQLQQRRTYKNNEQGDVLESDIYDGDGVLKSHYVLCYDDRGNMTEQSVYNGEGTLVKAIQNQYTYEKKKLTAVQQKYIEGAKEQHAEFTVTHDGQNATVTAAHVKGEYFTATFAEGTTAAKYALDDNGKLILKETFHLDGSLAERHGYTLVPVKSENKWQQVDPKMLLDVLLWFY